MTNERARSAEDEYFARQEFERRKAAAEARHLALEAGERERLRELHHMRCPKCGMELVETGHRGIRIDQCTACAGIWLDAGELEQVVNAEAGFLGGFLRVFRG